jgi:hypothetical protein
VIAFNASGSIKLLEPEEGAPAEFVTWRGADEHAERLRDRGFANARLWTPEDAGEIFRNVAGAGRNDASKLDLTGASPSGFYWGATEHPRDPGAAMVYSPGDNTQHWFSKRSFVCVRCVQDDSKLSLSRG